MARILMVEDDEIFAEIATDCLESAGHMVSVVHHGDEALRAIAASEPDLLILDHDLPGSSGLSILRHVRGHFRMEGMPIMMLTAKTGRLLPARAHHDGADDYVSKPIMPDALLDRVEALLKRAMTVRRAAYTMRSEQSGAS